MRSGRIPCHQHQAFTITAGGPGVLLLTWSNKARQQDGIPELATPAYLHFRDAVIVLLAPLVAALFVLLVLSGNVFAARRKPSDCEPKLIHEEPYPSRD